MAGSAQTWHRQLRRGRCRGLEPLQKPVATLDGEDRSGYRPTQARSHRYNGTGLLGHPVGTRRGGVLHAADVAVLLCGQQLKVHRIERDDELIAKLMLLQERFWRYV